jgi:hypothetical protein
MHKFSFKVKQGGKGNIVEFIDPCFIVYKDIIYDIETQTIEFYSYDNLMMAISSRLIQKEIDKEILKDLLEAANQSAIIEDLKPTRRRTAIMSTPPLITKPMSLEEINKIADKEGCFEINVLVDLDDVIECSGCDGFLDLLDDLVTDYSWSMSDIRYKVTGSQEGDIVLNVEAFIEDFGTKMNPDADPEDDTDFIAESVEWDELT